MAIYYVDNVTGSNGDNGLTTRTAFATIQYALSLGGLADGDTICIINSGTTYYGPVKLTAKKNIRITSSTGTPATVSPSRRDAGSWTVSSGSVYSYTVPAGYVLDSDPLTIYENNTRATRSTAAPASLSAGQYTFNTGVLYYHSTASVDPDAATGGVDVPVQVTAATPTRWLELSGDCSGLIVENLNIINCGKYAFYLNSSSEKCIIRNVTITRCIENPIYIGSDNNRVLDCSIYDNGTKMSGDTALTITGVDEAAIHIDGVEYNQVSRNLIDNFVKSGIKVTGQNNAITNNEIKRQKGVASGGGLYCYNNIGTNYNYFVGNVIYGCNENAVNITGSSYNIIANNTIAFNSRAIYITKKDDSTVGESNHIVNNIIAFNGVVGTYLTFWNTNDPDNRGIRTSDVHIAYDDDEEETIIDTLKNSYFRNNLYYRASVEGNEDISTSKFVLGSVMYNFDTWQDYAGIEVNNADGDSIYEDPLFKDPLRNVGDLDWDNAVKDDFRLELTSPAIDAAKPLKLFGDSSSSVWKMACDIHLIGAEYDIGAFENETTALDPLKDLIVKYTIPEVVADANDQTTLSESNSLTSYGGLSGKVARDSVVLFPEIDATEIADSVTRYRALDIKNTAIHPTAIAGAGGLSTNIGTEEGRLVATTGDSGVGLYIATQADDGTEYNCQWEDPSGGYQAAQVNDTTNPSLTPDFSVTPPESDSKALRQSTVYIESTTTSADGDSARFWIKRIVDLPINGKFAEEIKLIITGEVSSG